MALTDKINAYLEQNSIAVSPGDYQIGQPEGGVDQILHWDGMRLGPEPSQTQLDTAWATKVTQNVYCQQYHKITILLQISTIKL